MARTQKAMIIAGLNGKPINDMVVGWTFTIDEVSSNVFDVEAVDFEGRFAMGAGIGADDAINDCLKQVKRRLRPFAPFWRKARKVAT